MFGQIDKAYKVHVESLTFCSLPLSLTTHRLVFFFLRNYHTWALITLFMFHLLTSILLHLLVLQKDQLLRQLNNYFLKNWSKFTQLYMDSRMQRPQPIHCSQITMNEQLLIGCVGKLPKIKYIYTI